MSSKKEPLKGVYIIRSSRSEVPKKLMQPHVLETFGPVDSTKPTKKQSAEAVTSLMLPNDNLNGDIYGRACVEVRKHRDKIKK